MVSLHAPRFFCWPAGSGSLIYDIDTSSSETSFLLLLLSTPHSNPFGRIFSASTRRFFFFYCFPHQFRQDHLLFHTNELYFFFFPVKSARFSCDTIIEITTPESSSSSSSSPAAAVNIDDEEVKPKWYPGPQQVPGWGYLHNMGYPEYYRGGSSGPVDCRWTIRATHGRRVRLTFLDLSIRSKCSTTRYITHTVLPSWL